MSERDEAYVSLALRAEAERRGLTEEQARLEGQAIRNLAFNTRGQSVSDLLSWIDQNLGRLSRLDNCEALRCICSTLGGAVLADCPKLGRLVLDGEFNFSTYSKSMMYLGIWAWEQLLREPSEGE